MKKRLISLMLVLMLLSCGTQKSQPTPDVAKWNRAQWNESNWEK